MQNNSASVNVDISCLGCSDMLRENWTARNLRPLIGQFTLSNCSVLLLYIPRKDERLSRPGWLTYSGRFTHITGHLSAAGRAQDSKSSPVRDRRSTTVPRNQPRYAWIRTQDPTKSATNGIRWFPGHVLHRDVNSKQDVIKMSDRHRNVVIR